LSSLRRPAAHLAAGDYAAGDYEVVGLNSRSIDIECVIEPRGAETVGFLFEGLEAITYDVAFRTMRVLGREHAWPLEPDGTLTLRVLFDVNCVEVFGPNGLKVMSGIYSPDILERQDERQPFLSLRVLSGPARVTRMVAYPVRSIWQGDSVEPGAEGDG